MPPAPHRQLCRAMPCCETEGPVCQVRLRLSSRKRRISAHFDSAYCACLTWSHSFESTGTGARKVKGIAANAWTRQVPLEMSAPNHWHSQQLTLLRPQHHGGRWPPHTTRALSFIHCWPAHMSSPAQHKQRARVLSNAQQNVMIIVPDYAALAGRAASLELWRRKRCRAGMRTWFVFCTLRSTVAVRRASACDPTPWLLRHRSSTRARSRRSCDRVRLITSTSSIAPSSPRPPSDRRRLRLRPLRGASATAARGRGLPSRDRDSDRVLCLLPPCCRSAPSRAAATAPAPSNPRATAFCGGASGSCNRTRFRAAAASDAPRSVRSAPACAVTAPRRGSARIAPRPPCEPGKKLKRRPRFADGAGAA